MDETDNAGDKVVGVEQQLAALAERVARLERAAPIVVEPAEIARQRSEAVAALETTLGTYWLSRIGIVSLITGAALLIITYFGQLGPVLRVALGYAMAAVLAWAGVRMSQRHRMFGRVVFGGGLAIAYFVTYALHFVPAMRIIDSETIGVVLVALAIAGIVTTAHRMRSETVAGIALFLGLHTGMLSEVTALSLVCTTLLAAGAGFFLAANRWVIVPISTVVAVYTTHATLVLGNGGGAVSPGLSVAFLCVDFVLFAVASLIRPDMRTRSVMALTLLNWLGVIMLGSHALHAVSDDAVFYFLCAFAVVHGLLAVLASARNAPRIFIAFQVALAIVTLSLALPVRMAGWELLSGWIALALAAAFIARRTDSAAFGWVALVILLVVQGHTYLEHLGAPAQLACVLAFFTAERLHARSDRDSMPRLFLLAGVTLGLLQFAVIAFPSGIHSIGWVIAAFVLFATGFALRSSPYRWSAFGVLAIATVRLLAIELRVFSANQRILTFVGAGVLLLIVSFVYTRVRSQRATKT